MSSYSNTRGAILNN